MTGLLGFDELNVVREGTCPLFISEGFWSGLMVAVDFYPSVITVAFFTISLYQHEFYLFLLSLCLAADTGINIALQYIIRQPGPFPGCGTAFEMPSFATQHSALLVCMLMSFMLLWRVSVPSKKIFLLFFFEYAVILARIYCGINSRWQLLAGSLVGTVEGLVFQSIIYFLIYPRYKNILSWRLVAFLDIQDHLLSPEEEEGGERPAELPKQGQLSMREEERVPLVVVPLQPQQPVPRQRQRHSVRFADQESAEAARAGATNSRANFPVPLLFIPLGTRVS